MPRGGKREKAGRKTGWESGVKFEETTPIRVPKYIKDKLLEIAHKLDAGEDFDSVSNSNKQELEELQSRLSLIELENRSLLEQVERYHLDLETKSKLSNSLNSQLDDLAHANESLVRELENLKLDLDSKSKELGNKVFELEKQNKELQNELLKSRQEFSFNYSNHFYEIVEQFSYKWQNELSVLMRLNADTKIHRLLAELKEIIAKEKCRLDLVTNSKIIDNTSKNEEILGQPKQNEKVTKSKGHTQLGLLDIKNDENNINLKPLTASELSRRFNKRDDFVRVKKFYYKDRIEEFELLLKENDPDGVVWRYSEEDKKYHPVI